MDVIKYVAPTILWWRCCQNAHNTTMKPEEYSQQSNTNKNTFIHQQVHYDKYFCVYVCVCVCERVIILVLLYLAYGSKEKTTQVESF